MADIPLDVLCTHVLNNSTHDIRSAMVLAFALGKCPWSTFVKEHANEIEKHRPTRVGDVFLCVYKYATRLYDPPYPQHVVWKIVTRVTRQFIFMQTITDDRHYDTSIHHLSNKMYTKPVAAVPNVAVLYKAHQRVPKAVFVNNASYGTWPRHHDSLDGVWTMQRIDPKTIDQTTTIIVRTCY